MRLFGARL